MACYAVIIQLWISTALTNSQHHNSINVNPWLGAVKQTVGKGEDKVYCQ